MKNHLILHVNKMEILNDRQFGFPAGLSTSDAINAFTSDLYTAHQTII